MVKFIALTFLMTLISVTPFSYSKADTDEFVSLLKAQDSSLKKAIVCYRVWSINSASFELGLLEDIRNNNSRGKRSANALLQTHTRVVFLEILSEAEGLNDLLKAGYSSGASMDHLAANDLIKNDCTVGVNEIMKKEEYKPFLDEALAKSKEHLKEVIKKSGYYDLPNQP